MAWRFRKSVKIAPGIRLNFSKSGVSTTIGDRGSSINLGKRGVYHNMSIPGTGLSNRTRLTGGDRQSSSGRKRTSHRPGRTLSPARQNQGTEQRRDVQIKLDSSGKLTFLDEAGREITDAQLIAFIKRMPEFKAEKARLFAQLRERGDDLIEDEQEKLEKIVCLYQQAPAIRPAASYEHELATLEPQRAIRRQFDKPMPTPEDVQDEVSREADRAVTTKAFWKVKSLKESYFKEHFEQRYHERVAEWQAEKDAFDTAENEACSLQDELFYAAYAERAELLPALIAGDADAIEEEARAWIEACQLPFAASAQYEYRADQRLLMVDIDLPEIDDLPQMEHVQLKSGALREKQKSQTKLRQEYAQCVFGFVVYATANLFNVSPAVDYVCASAYTQRRNKIGDEVNVYVLSVLFDRERFMHCAFAEQDPESTCMAFPNRCKLTKTKAFDAIVPYD